MRAFFKKVLSNLFYFCCRLLHTFGCKKKKNRNDVRKDEEE